MASRQTGPVDRVLTTHATHYANEKSDFIADKVFPEIFVDAEVGSHYVRNPEGGFSVAASLPKMRRAFGAPYPTVEIDYTNQSLYNLGDLGLQGRVEDRKKERLAVDGIKLERDTVEEVVDNLFIARERMAEELIMDSSNWTHSTAVGSSDRWDTSTGDPRTSVNALANQIRLDRGIKKNMLSMVIGWEEWEILTLNPVLREIFKHTDAANGIELSVGALVRALGIREIIVGGAIENTAKPGLSASNSDIWGGDRVVWLGHIERNARSENRPHGMGACFKKRGIGPGGRVYRSTQDNPRATVVQIEYVQQMKITDTRSGGCLTTVAAA